MWQCHTGSRGRIHAGCTDTPEQARCEPGYACSGPVWIHTCQASAAFSVSPCVRACVTQRQQYRPGIATNNTKHGPRQSTLNQPQSAVTQQPVCMSVQFLHLKNALFNGRMHAVETAAACEACTVGPAHAVLVNKYGYGKVSARIVGRRNHRGRCWVTLRLASC